MPLTAGCHHVSVMHAHAGGAPHGLTLRVQLKHMWKCAKHALHRIPASLVTNPSGCQCNTLPPDRPIELDPVPAPPPPVPAPVRDVCPPEGLNRPGWELCAWHLPFQVEGVPNNATDLEGVDGLDVRF